MNIISIIITAIFAVLGCQYVNTLESYNELIIPALCLVIPMLVVLVLLAVQALYNFFHSGWLEAERRIKEQSRDNSYRRI